VTQTEALAASLASVYLRLTRLLDKRMAREGASLARTRVLLMIERRGPVKARDIAELFGLAPRSVTDTLDGMERQGLIRREPDPFIMGIVANWAQNVDSGRARRLGFTVEKSFDEIIRAHIEDELPDRIA